MAKNLSKFVFKQLAYDYLQGELSGEELVKFEAKIKAEGDCFDYIELTKQSLSYVKSISELSVNLETIYGLSDYRDDGLFYFYNPFSFKIPKFIKVGLPVIGLVSIALITFYILPIKSGINWFQNKLTTVAISDAEPVTENMATSNVEVRDVKIINEPPIAVNNFKPIKKNVSNTAAATGEVNENKTSAVNEVSDNKAVDEINLNNESKNIQSQEFVTMINDIPVAEDKPLIKVEKKIAPEPVKEVVKKKKGPQGTLYRVYMSIRNLDTKAPLIVDIIEQMSGEKAGKQSLGYLKPKGRSFHFKLPLNYREQVFEQLKAFGRVKIDKEKHWRKMPEGQSRVILWVEDLDLKAQRERSR